MPHRKEMPNKSELKSLVKTKTVMEIARGLGISRRTTQRLLKEYGLRYKDIRYGNELAIIQNELLIACLLGDGGIRKLDKKTKQYPRFKFKQKSTRREYVEYAWKTLLPFSGKMHLSRGVRNGTKTEAWVFETTHHEVFDNLRKKWYPFGIKIVPYDIQLNNYILAHWFLQDGHNASKKHAASISTNAFTEKEVLFLIDRLKDIGIHTSLQHVGDGPIIYIGVNQYDEFMSRISPYCQFECFKYKVPTISTVVKPNKEELEKFQNDLAGGAKAFDVSERTIRRWLEAEGLYRPMEGYGPNKLTPKQVDDIRHLHTVKKYTQSQLGKRFGVTQATIGRIINNIYHKKADLKIGGAAIVSFREKPRSIESCHSHDILHGSLLYTAWDY